MTPNRLRSAFVAVAAAALTLTAGCDLDVQNPNIIEARNIDAEKDAAMLAKSAMQDWTRAYQWFVYYSGYFTGEFVSAHIQDFANHSSQRNVQPDETNGEYWAPVSQARKSGAEVLGILRETDGFGSNVNVVRASYVTGYSFLYMADNFCRAAVDVGPAIQRAALLDSAVVHFSRAIETAQANGSQVAMDLGYASQIGRANAYLSAGQADQARADAAAIPEGFVYVIDMVSDPQDRRTEEPRLGNQIYRSTWFGDKVLSVGEAYRNLGDPRIDAVPPSEHDISPRDGFTEYWAQNKYPDFGADFRLASHLEARYIMAEVDGTSAMLDLIQDRRAANGQPSYEGSTAPDSVLAEFLWQKSLDFWLEGKKMADFRRHGEIIPGNPEPGTPYHKPGFDAIGDQTCFPLPLEEIRNNPNISS